MPIITIAPRRARNHRFQCQEPRGPLGKVVLWSMNRRHARVTNWGLRNVSIEKTDTILDVGCGGGRTIAKLAAAAPMGQVYGIDHAALSVAAARRLNHESVDAGRVVIQQASVSTLPFADNTFNLVTAVETHFWWGDLHAGMREIFRVLKPGGRLAIIAEFYNGGRHAKYAERLSRHTTIAVLDVSQHRALFVDAGFADVRVIEDQGAGWICAIGTK